jgi:signal transduction histidine kinase
VELTVVERAHTVDVRVSDDGVGIPDADVEHLFEPFYRADKSRTKATGGYGLGLSICKRVMEAHGGSIAVERNTARGATFVLAFPRAR